MLPKSVKAIFVGAAAAGLIVAVSPAASAAPVLAVTPSTDLVDGQTATAAVSGFKPATTVFVTECATVASNALACDAPSAVQLTTDASGAGSSPITVRKTFNGFLSDGKPYGPVDCGSVPGGCLVAAGDNDHVDGGLAPISFR